MDRNNPPIKPAEIGPKSLSARRAWIEIMRLSIVSRYQLVALRKESVDRNPLNNFTHGRPIVVALRKESVDRNKYVVQCRKILGGRSPQGERG